MLSRPDLGVPPLLGYTANALDRAADRRQDAAAIAAFESDPRARIHLIGGEIVVAHKLRDAHDDGGDDPAFTLVEAAALAPWRDKVFLGLLDGAPRFAAGIDKAAVEALKARDDLLVTDLRSIAMGGLLAPEHLPPLAEAKAVLGWHARHRFCANCGTPSRVVDAGWRRDCPACGTQHFPRTDPVVIMLAIDGERCLLGRSPRFAPRMWSCLAGFVEPGETIEEAVRRETREEVRHRMRARRLFRLAAVAVSDVADDRLLRRGGHRPRSRSIAPSSRTCAGSPATRSSPCCCAGIPTA